MRLFKIVSSIRALLNHDFFAKDTPARDSKARLLFVITACSCHFDLLIETKEKNLFRAR
jgi:hypothetical protein